MALLYFDGYGIDMQCITMLHRCSTLLFH